MIVFQTMWAEPKPGHESAYALAWKHRVMWLDVRDASPWWQFGRRRRCLDGWRRAVARIKQHGRHVITWEKCRC